jgi:hypothetical protein
MSRKKREDDEIKPAERSKVDDARNTAPRAGIGLAKSKGPEYRVQ